MTSRPNVATPRGSNPCSGEPGNPSPTVEHRPEVAHQVCSHPPGPRAQKAREGMQQGFERSSRLLTVSLDDDHGVPILH